MKKLLFLASMSISMLAVATMSSCSEHKSVTSDLEGAATSVTRLNGEPQMVVQGFTGALKTKLAALGSRETYAWSSDNQNVVKVDQKGVVTGVAIGTANIHVKRLSYEKVELESETFTVTVTDVIPIPDKVFKAALVRNADINKNLNNEIEISEAMAFNRDIDISSVVVIESLDGLKYFKNLKALNCSNTGITYLDLSGNTALESLNCSKCEKLVGSVRGTSPANISQISLKPRSIVTPVPGASLANELDLTNNSRLTTVDCSQTPKLTNIGVSRELYNTVKNWTIDKDDKFTVHIVMVVPDKK